MGDNLNIVAKNGKVYKDIRAYHIAIGHAIRQALLNFYKDVKKYAIREISNYYSLELHGSEFYENTYGMLEALMDSDDVNGAITYFIKGNWEGNTTFNINIDWSYLDAHSNGNGQWGTYMSLNGEDVTAIWDELLQQGLPIGLVSKTGERHTPFNLKEKIEEYIEKNLKNVVNNVLRKF